MKKVLCLLMLSVFAMSSLALADGHKKHGKHAEKDAAAKTEEAAK